MYAVKLSQVEASLQKMDEAEAWHVYLGWLRESASFIDDAIVEMARQTELKPDKTSAHRKVMRASFDLMDDWYYARKPLVKARRNEVESAISFLRNTALQTGVNTMPGAACARNLATALRLAAHLATHAYPSKDYPHVIASSLFSIAAARASFPADTADFVGFLRPGETIVAGTFNGQPAEADIDNMHVMLKRGCKQYGLYNAYKQLEQELALIYQDLATPHVWNVPDTIWNSGDSSLLADIHYQALNTFLRPRPR